MTRTWRRVGDEHEFAEGLKLVMVEKRKLVLARLKGELYAFDAKCPHAGGPMELSEVEGAVVSCPLHAWRFDLENGGVELHGYRGLQMQDVKVEDGGVYVAL